MRVKRLCFNCDNIYSKNFFKGLSRFEVFFTVIEKYKSSVIDTAIDDSGSRSHGRNLLKKGKSASGNGIDNPYCRTWTFLNQYKKIENQIRPFDNLNRENLKKENKPYRANGDGDYLTKNTVLNLNNGRVNVAPSKNGKVDIKKCMFSIENLAWKDVLKSGENLSKEQIGPSGGRIMWFPPYGLDFSESVNVNWDNNTFIGRLVATSSNISLNEPL